MPSIYIRNYYGVFMKVKLLNDPYFTWEGMAGKTLTAFEDKEHPRGCFVSMEEANQKGAKDFGRGQLHSGYRFLLRCEYDVVEK